MPQDASWLWKTLYIILKLISPLFCRLRVEGQEHIPRTGGCIIASTHTMGPDYILLGYASTRQLYYMAKIELFRVHPLFSRFLYAVGAFPIDRGRSDVGAVQAAIAWVKRGKVLGMFPEGTRSRTGQLGRGKSGVARIAMATGVPVVPAAVTNSHLIFKQLGRRPEITVRFGPSILLAGDASDKTRVQEQTERVMYALAALLPEARRGDYREVQPDLK